MLIFILFLMQFALSSVMASDDAPKFTSMTALLASPRSFDGSKVILTGYVCGKDRSRGIFLTRSDCVDENYSNGIKLDISKTSKKIPDKATLLTVEGVFKSWGDYFVVDEQFLWGEISVSNVSGRTLR